MRLASAAQRIVLLSGDRGCTLPGCTVSGHHTQVHHISGWKSNGQSNIDEDVQACPGDNRLAEEGWTVRIRNGLAEWVPPRTPDVPGSYPGSSSGYHPTFTRLSRGHQY